MDNKSYILNGQKSITKFNTDKKIDRRNRSSYIERLDVF